MPGFRKLSETEVVALRARKGVDLEAYEDFLRGCTVGEWGEATVAADEKKATVKRRLTNAARRLGVTLNYRRSESTKIVFEIRP